MQLAVVLVVDFRNARRGWTLEMPEEAKAKQQLQELHWSSSAHSDLCFLCRHYE